MILADSGTPLMAVDTFYLVIGNAVIGILEGVLLWRMFRVNRKRAIGIMVLANYISMTVGWYGVKAVESTVCQWVLGDEALYNISKLIAVLVGLSFVITLVVEWPFVYWGLRGTERRIRRSLYGNLIVQTASYLLLCPGIAYYSHMLNGITPDRTMAATSPNDATVFFVGKHDGALYRIGVNGDGLQKVSDMSTTARWSPMLEYNEGCRRWDLLGPGGRPIVRGVASDLFANDNSGLVLPFVYPFARGRGLDFRAVGVRRWSLFSSGFYISAEDSETKERYVIGVEVPFLHWATTAPIMLPGERAVFQMGDQIVLADMNLRKICMLAPGTAPVVIPNRYLTGASVAEPTSQAKRLEKMSPDLDSMKVGGW